MPKKTEQFVSKTHFDGSVASIRADITDAIRHFNTGLGKIDLRIKSVEERITDINSQITSIRDRIDIVESKLDAVIEILTTRKEFLQLLLELKRQGIAIDETRILTK